MPQFLSTDDHGVWWRIPCGANRLCLPKGQFLSLTLQGFRRSGVSSILQAEDERRRDSRRTPPGHTIRIDDRKGGAAPDFRLTSLERRALEYLQSDDFLLDWKLKRGQVGDVIDSKDKVVFKPYTVHAIEKVLKHL